MLKLQGAFTALITPMKDTGEVDYDGYGNLIEFQIREGIDGILVLGTTGETPTLGEDEEKKLIKIAAKKIKGRVPLIVGAGSNSTMHMEKYVAQAKDLGADAALVVTPYYNKPNDDGLYRHFVAASKAGIPVIVYNIASRTARNIQTSLMEKIAVLPNIVGVKESSGDLGQIGDNINNISIPRRNSANPFHVLSGDDSFALPVMAMGGDGIISVISNLVPARVKALAAACLSGNYEEGRKIHYELLPLMRAAFVETNPVPIKQAMVWAGLPAGPVRLPLGNLSESSKTVLKNALTAAGIKIKVQ
ncbi:MAG: 4-hydroxy-tetrahydrodipicolinate synthase [Treponema sp.]|nr:4-hydroxy-tetrahydrodipicolinate synthase [Treponema sp.]